MKLSEKGFHKVLRTCRFDEDRATYVLKYSEAIKDYFFEVQGAEFEPNDFEGCVVLTVEEAKKIANDLLVYERLYRGAINNSSISGQDSLDEFCNSQSQKLFKRIEQAEMSKQST